MRIVLLGAPGAGKGTQAHLICNEYKLPHISTGEIFRRHMRDKTPLGVQIEEFMVAGHLVPDHLACRIMAERTVEEDCRNGYLLDGFPRTLPQSVELSRLLDTRGTGLDAVVNLHVPDDELVERLSARRVCSSCGLTFNLKFSPPKTDNICDRPECQSSALVQRDDDKEETVRERLRVYHEQTEPLLQYYRTESVLRNIAGAGRLPSAIFTEIQSILNESGAPKVS